MLAATWALPGTARRTLSRWLRRPAAAARGLLHPVVVVGAHAWLVLFWHVPAAYDRALASTWLHALEHASFLLPALAFWSLVLPLPGRARHPYPAAIAMIFFVMLVTTGLGALMTLSPQPWYASYEDGALWGYSRIEDQQLAGALMWVVGGFIYAGVAAWLFISWLAIGRRRDAAATRKLAVGLEAAIETGKVPEVQAHRQNSRGRKAVEPS
jgi:putative membrane protein